MKETNLNSWPEVFFSSELLPDIPEEQRYQKKVFAASKEDGPRITLRKPSIFHVSKTKFRRKAQH
jgi:hypothetical protein